MKINWKERINAVFITQILLSIFVPILSYFGLTAQDLTTWQSLFELIVKAVSNPYVLGTIAVSVWNSINNPTVKGLGDCHKRNNN